MSTYILCAQCGQATPKRGNKLFCSPACRAQHFRDNLAPLTDADQEWDEDLAEAPASDETAFALVRSVPLAPVPTVTDADTWAPSSQALTALIADAVRDTLQHRSAQAAQAQVQTRHQDYLRWVQSWLQREGQPLTARAVAQHLKEVAQLCARYQAHAAITQAGHPSQLRLQLLYKVGDALRALQDELAAPAGLWGRSTPTGPLTFSKKRRQQLRESLLGEG